MEDVAQIVARIRANGTTRRAAGTIKSPGKPPNYEEYGIYKRFQSVTFDAIEERGIPDALRENYARAKEYAARLDEHIARGEGLILGGGYGTMKTTLAVAILRAHIDRGGHGLFLPMCSMMDDLFTMRDLNREEYARYERRLRSTTLLVLDDLGSEDTGRDWVRAKADSIITERYNKMLPVIITTNHTLSELTGTYSGRITDRLRSTSEYLVFGGRSQRESMGGKRDGQGEP